MCYIFEAAFLRDGDHFGSQPEKWYSPDPILESFELRVLFEAPTSVEKLKDVVGVGEYCVMKRHLIEAIRNLGETQIEDYPFRAEDKKGGMTETFRVVRAYNPVSCIDTSVTLFESDCDGYIRRISRLVIDESRIPRNRHLFRAACIDPKLFAPPMLVASQQMKDVFRRLKVKGMDFMEVDKYRL